MRVWGVLALSLSLVAGPVWAASQERSVQIDGRERSYLVYRPQNLDRAVASPLVVVLHGGYGSAAQAEHSYGWDDEAEARGFIVAYADGVGHSWNAGGSCCGPAQKAKIDDVGFIKKMIETIIAEEKGDPKRVYLAGISNGGAMAYRFACEGAFPLAAVGSISGSMSFDCRSPHPTSIMEIHGANDQTIPLDGGRGKNSKVRVNWQPVAQVLQRFAAAAGCAPPYRRSENGVTKAMGACSLGREVALVTIDGAGHQWPGGVARGPVASRLFNLDQPSGALNATSTLYTFFMGHSLP